MEKQGRINKTAGSFKRSKTEAPSKTKEKKKREREKIQIANIGINQK